MSTRLAPIRYASSASTRATSACSGRQLMVTSCPGCTFTATRSTSWAYLSSSWSNGSVMDGPLPRCLVRGSQPRISAEHHERPAALAALHPIERGRYTVQVDPVGHQGRQVEAAGHDVGGQSREVGRRVAVAVDGAG